MREHQLSQKELDDALNFASGLKGIGGSSDMRDLLNKQNEEQARLAVQMFVHRLKTAIGSMAVSLEGFDILGFTGGIGENASFIRKETCRGLACLNVAIDFEKNDSCQPDADISISDSLKRILVLRTREEWMIARACYTFE
jgi:acetate kinase